MSTRFVKSYFFLHKNFILLLLFIGFNLLCFSQHPYASFNPIILNQHHDFGDGKITDLKEDWLGFIWIATTDGLYRFDGTESIRYDNSGTNSSIINSYVTCLLIDKEREKIWVGTRGGLTGLHPIQGNSIHFQSNYLDTSTIADNHIIDLYKTPKNEIWISCFSRGLSKFDPKVGTFKNYYFSNPSLLRARKENPSVNNTFFNNIYKISSKPNNGKLLFLATGGGIVIFNTEEEIFYQISNELTNYTTENKYLDKSIDNVLALDSQIIFIHRGQLLNHDLIKNQTSKIILGNKNESQYIKNIFQYSPTHIQASGYDYDAIINGESSSTTDEKRKSGRQWQKSLFLLEDSKGQNWYTSSIGLLLEPTTDHYPKAYYISNMGNSRVSTHVKQNGDTVLVLTDDHTTYHLFDYNSKKWTSRKIHFHGIPAEIKSWQDVIHDKGNYYLVLTQKHLGRLDINTGRLENIPLNIKSDKLSFLRILKDSRNNLWISTPFDGLYQIDLKTGHLFHHKSIFSSPSHESLYSWIYHLFEDSKGRIWVRLSRSYAVYHPDQKEFEVFAHEKFQPQTFRYVSNFTEDEEGNLWMGSLDEGIGKIDLNQIEKGIIEKYDKKNGMLHNNNYQLSYGGKNALWNLNHGGLSFLDLQEHNLINKTWDQGILKSISFEIFADGSVGLILREGGICLVPKPYFTQDLEPPTPFIKKVYSDTSLIHRGLPGIKDTLKFSGTQENIHFEFSAIGFENPKEFAYILEGIDKKEVLTSNRQSPIYSNLTPSNYVFKVRSRSKHGIWSEPQLLYLRISPKWFQTIWLKISLILAGLAIIYLLYLNRLKEIRKKIEFEQQIRNLEMQTLRAQMNPHFLYNSLNSIQNFIIKNKTKEAVGYLDKFSRLVRLILQNSRSKRIPLRDEIEAIKYYLDLEALRFKNAFDYKIHISPFINIDDIEIPPMLLQPFIENAILHGLRHKHGKGHILIDVNILDEQIECVIRDNGIGRKASTRINESNISNNKSLSTAITLDRIQVLNDEFKGAASMNILDLEDTDGNALGTEVRILVPV